MDWKKKTYLIAGIVGMVAGLMVARMRIQNAEENNEQLKLDAKEGARIGMVVIDAVKRIA